ncbi:MAG: SpoIIE family protein phosphatase [Acidobacteriota bacterium]
MSAPAKHSARVFLVDDDSLILSALSTFLAVETDYHVEAFDNPLRALDQLQRVPVDLLISDYLMPGLNGIEFLKRAREIQPDTPRILLTGFADKENAIRGINEIGLYQYVEKPWDSEAFLLVIRNALREKSLRSQLTAKVRALDRLLLDHRRLEERHDQLQNELRMAADVQRGLFPNRLPERDGFRFSTFYQPCRAIGGDYYDFLERERDTVLLLADVSGHGIQAALTGLFVKSVFQEAAQDCRDADQLLREMNGKLHRYLPEEMFVAAAVITIDYDTAGVQLVNAGLPFPFLLSASSNRLDEVPVAGVPLGLFGSEGPFSCESRELSLTPGDVLLVSTDGLGDLQNRGSDFFHETGLRSCLAGLPGLEGGEVIARLTQEAAQFREGTDSPDDITLLTVTRT